MRIGFVVAGGVDASGTHRVIPHLLDRLRALSARHDVRVVALRQEPEPGSWTVAGARVWNVGRRPRRLGAVRALMRLHGQEPFDVLHAFALVPQGVVTLVASRLLGVPAVVEAPGGEFVALPEVGFGGWRRWPGRAWIRLALCAGPLVVPTEAARRVAESRGASARVIPLEIDPARWPPRGEDPAPDAAEEARLCWVGTLNAVKNPGLLLDVMAELVERGHPVYADVVGEDIRSGVVQAEAARRGLAPHMTFHGFLPQDELRALLARASLLVSTSRFEAGGRTVLEAATQGVPVVGFGHGQWADWSPGAAAVVEPPSASALADALVTLLADPERRRFLAREAGRRVVEHHTDRVARHWEDVYAYVRGTAPEPVHG